MKNFLWRIFLFTFFSIVLIATYELVCTLVKVPKISHINIKAKGQALIPQIDNNSIILLGDSRLEWGLKTQEIHNADGNVLNLAFPGSNGLDILQYLLKNKIYPKIIIMGFTPNYYKYKNHNFDILEPSTIVKYKEAIEYQLKELFYFADYESLSLFLKGRLPMGLYHIYDDFGNVDSKERGDFNARYQRQKARYTEKKEQFDEMGYAKFVLRLNSMIKKFRGKSEVYGIYMPVSEEIFSLEKGCYKKTKISNIYDQYFDFSDFIPKNDSLYFYDGSHLTSEYGIEFTKKLNRIINKNQYDKK